ncbi:MAG: alpha/beta hydrolase family protein, partial [Anaerolineales bacterium]
MALDVSSFPAYVRSLNISAPVTTKPRRFVSGPPAPIVELVLRLGLGPWVFDTPRNRELVATLGLKRELLGAVTQRLRTRTEWLAVWEELAHEEIEIAERAAAKGENDIALAAIRSALLMFSVGLSGDGLYFYSSMEARWSTYARRRRLHALHHRLTGAQIERVFLHGQSGSTWGILHFPPERTRVRGLTPALRSSERERNGSSGALRAGTTVPLSPTQASLAPALVCLHPLGSDKETFDYCLRHFRAAGYATLCVDLPAHGEVIHGPRLQAESEWVGVLALEALARHPDIDPNRLGVLGGSLGAYYALRTAAHSPLARACLAFATPFDLGVLGPAMMPGIVSNFAWTIGALTRAEVVTHGNRFHLRDVAERITCPVGLVH